MNREEQIRENRRKGAEKARAKLRAKYSEEELTLIRGKGGKNNSTKFNSESGKLAAKARWHGKSSKEGNS